MKPLLKLDNAAVEAATFNVLQPDGFLVPYGKYPHKAGLQIFDRTAAETMAGDFTGILNKISNAIAGPAVYIGHPDVPGRGMEFPDKKAYGRITGIEPREDGCFFRAKMNREGAELIESCAFAYYSPYWGCERTQGGIRPVRLYSMGLTNQPNIDVPALANEAEPEAKSETQPTNDDPMKDTIKAALLKRGLITETSTEEEAEAALVALISELETETEEKEEEPAKEEKPKEEEKPKPEETPEQKAEREAMEKKKMAEEGAANDRYNTARSFIISTAIANAVAGGKITGAEMAGAKAELEALENTADLTAAAAKLVAGEMKLKTKTTAELGKDAKEITAANESDRKSKARAELVEECKKTFPSLTGGALHDAAWNAARRKQPDLF